MSKQKYKYKEGQTVVWNPINYVSMKLCEDHPWAGSEVTVLQTPTNPNYPLYQIRVCNAPKVNDPHAFDFWVPEEELQK